jgi:two-component system sensor histidine kinase and response regulator WspE
MSNAELLEFLFLPAFSLKETTSELSGRGVGLDVVHDTIRNLYGSVRLETEAGKGFRVHITLPLSQSVVRVVVADVGGEAYAVPIAKVERIMTIAPDAIRTLEDRQFFTLGDEHIGLVSAAQLLDLGDMQPLADTLPVIIIGSAQRRYALAVDKIRGEQNLAVQPIDTLFGKLRDISAAGLLDDGNPVLILDIADLMLSIEKLAGEGHLQRMRGADQQTRRGTKRVLVVDDSLTVREMERKLLLARGFDVDVAVDGMDGWNAVRSSDYHLVITDVDMPRMDGIELVTLIKKDNRLHNLPVMIVSYKDRPEDRARGISAGADYYLTKGSFHDETLLEAVFDLIGENGA